MNPAEKYIQDLFSDKQLFEKEVMQVNCDEDRKEIMALMSKEICNESDIASQVNFLKIKSIDELDFSRVNISLVQIILAELLSLLKEKNYPASQIETIKKNKEHLAFIYMITQTYMRRFGSEFYKEVINTFFDLISIADKADKLSLVVVEAINGTQNKRSLMEQHGGGQILYKPEQAWMRVKQARDDKNKKVQVYQVEIVKLVRRVDQLKLQISAIAAARVLQLADVRNVTPSLLLDMFTEEDDIHLHTKKTMFSYVSTGEPANALIQIAQKGYSQATTPQDKEDFKKISDFFKKCNNTNTKYFIDARFEEYKQELLIKSDRYRQERLKLQTLRERSLDSFEGTLKRIKETMLYNLQQF